MMTYSETMEAIRKKLAAGTIPLDELLLHVEPVLNEAAAESGAQADARRIVNAIELAIFTQIEPQRTNLILKLIDDAIRLIRAETPSQRKHHE